MSRRMLFIIPPTLEMGAVARKMRVQNCTIPYGVLSIASYINLNSNAQIEILDLNVEPYSSCAFEQCLVNMRSRIADLAPDIVGLSVMYNHMYKYVGLLSKAIKAVDPTILVVAGGSCIMAYSEKLLEECEDLDAVCHSEGEIPVLNLLEADDTRLALEAHPAWLTYDGMSNGKHTQSVFVEDLDEIPPIDFDLIDLNLYGAHRDSFRPMKRERELILPIVTTRGCPYNCVFCIGGSLHGKKVRKLSPERVVSDVKDMISKYGMNVLSIEDDQFLVGRDRCKKMLAGLAELDIGIIADSGFTAMLLDDEIAQLLNKAGLQTAILAIESGSDYVLHDIINKPIKLDRVPSVVNSIRNNGMFCHCFLIFGLPGEKEEHRQQTVDFIKNVGLDWCNITCATPIKGSRLYDICVDNNYIDSANFSENGFYESCINTPDFSAKYITERAYIINLELNFVHNYRMRIKDYKTVILYMSHILRKYPDHAFAHYYMAKAYDGCGEESSTARHYYGQFERIVATSEEWKHYAEYFGLG